MVVHVLHLLSETSQSHDGKILEMAQEILDMHSLVVLEQCAPHVFGPVPRLVIIFERRLEVLYAAHLFDEGPGLGRDQLDEAPQAVAVQATRVSDHHGRLAPVGRPGLLVHLTAGQQEVMVVGQFEDEGGREVGDVQLSLGFRPGKTSR